ncbi:MFS transporter, partial [Bacillus velezensis]
MKHNHLKWLILSQSSVFFAGSLIFPFYILFIKNIGSSYTQFGLSYGLFGLSGALIHPLLGRLSARLDSRWFLMANSWGMAVLLLTLPHITGVHQ